jgi:adenine-specific DNA-methyltransferase
MDQENLMPTLNWIGKEAVVKHHKDVPYRLLEPVQNLSCGEQESGNLIVQGDNLHALKALLPRYAGKIKCIYIDPPYNTGNEGWIYNDNVNSAEIKNWLGEVVGKDDETLDRHDRWLCMMYPRLFLLNQFLKDDGVVFVSIDDNEVSNLRLLMDEIFGNRNYVSTIANVNNPKGRSDDSFFAGAHEYIVCYKKKNTKLSGFEPEEKITKRYNKLDKEGNKYREIDLRKTGDQDERKDRENMFYPFYYCKEEDDLIVGSVNNEAPIGYFEILPMKSKTVEGRWRWAKDNAKENISFLIARYMPNKKQWGVFEKDYLHLRGLVKPTSSWTFKDVNSERGTELFIKDLGFSKEEFPNPKPLGTIERLIMLATRDDKNSIIMDSFGGSGTTGHAVLKRNSVDKGNRKFILVEMNDDVAKNVTSARVSKVINGYIDRKGNEVAGLKSGFQFCKLSDQPLFTSTGQIREDVTFSQLAEFVWFAETGIGYTGNADSVLLGNFEGRAIYLLYNGILKDKSVSGGNVLTQPVYKLIPNFDGPKTIYGAACRGASWVKREQITFKQTPYALDV